MMCQLWGFRGYFFFFFFSSRRRHTRLQGDWSSDVCSSDLLNPSALARGMTTVILGIGVLYFVSVFLFCGLNKVEKERVAVILVLFFSSALFWSGFEQAGSSFNLFAERMTNRHWLGYEIPAGW